SLEAAWQTQQAALRDQLDAFALPPRITTTPRRGSPNVKKRRAAGSKIAGSGLADAAGGAARPA
ncbi:hypothetical protein, partial [Cronobacter sakazakii]|uniref:hypothetical protein n=1 Tax=Cronobacter sakazakii TaxID=28141 RepID=UPI0018F88D78